MIRLLDSIAQDRNIDRNLLLQDLEEAMKNAAQSTSTVLMLKNLVSR